MKIKQYLYKIIGLLYLISQISYFSISANSTTIADDEEPMLEIVHQPAENLLSSDSLLIGKEILSRPTDKAVTLHIIPSKDIILYIDYGLDSLNLSNRTESYNLKKDLPYPLLIDNLIPETKYFYRISLKESNSENFLKRNIYHFYTAKSKSKAFTFDIEADPHLDSNSIPEAYSLTLDNILKDKPDFLIDLGDNFMCEKLSDKSQKNITERHLMLRSFYERACHSVPLFLVLGNHEGEWGSLTDNNAKNLSILASNTRKYYFSNPEPNTFYSGNSTSEPQVGLRQNYYSWEWGNALFIVLDPYWYTNPKTGWGMTLGKDQYDWFKNSLKSSNAKYKFVFCHNLVGGANKDMRGGVEAADFYEWGGKDTNNVWSFDKNRPSWEKPIHQLMVEYGVSIFFHGHDHFYGYQEKDGIIYQEVPQPSNRNLTNLSAGSYGYKSGTLLPGRGFLRINVSDIETKVEYVGTLLPNEEKGLNKNGYVIHSYSVKPKASDVEFKVEQDFEINIYPNPSNGLITINADVSNCNEASIEIVEISTAKLIEKVDYIKIIDNKINYNLYNSRKLLNGSYSCRIISCKSINSTNFIINK